MGFLSSEELLQTIKAQALLPPAPALGMEHLRGHNSILLCMTHIPYQRLPMLTPRPSSHSRLREVAS